MALEAGDTLVYDDVPLAEVEAANAIIKAAVRGRRSTQQRVSMLKIAREMVANAIYEAETFGVSSIRIYIKRAEKK